MGTYHMMAAPVKSFLLGRLRLSPRQINKNKPKARSPDQGNKTPDRGA